MSVTNRVKEHVPLVEFRSFYHRRTVLTSISILTVVTGIIYAFVSKRTESAIAVALLSIATILLASAISSLHRYIVNDGVMFFFCTMPGASLEDIGQAIHNFHDAVFNTRYATICAVLYGFVVSVGVINFTGIDNKNLLLATSFGFFLFCVNFATGLGVYGITNLFIKVLQTGKLIQFSFWERDNPATKFTLNLSGKISAIGSAYTSLCMSSIFFLNVPLGVLVIAYSVFASFLCIFAYLIPTSSLRKKFLEEKRKALHETNQSIETEMKHLHKLRNQKGKAFVMSDDERENYDELVRQRDEIDGTQWPYSIVSVLLIIFILFVTALPAIIGIISAAKIG